MRELSILVVLLSYALCSLAQHSHNKVTSQVQRLVAASIYQYEPPYNYTGFQFDSISVKYSGGHSSEYDNLRLGYLFVESGYKVPYVDYNLFMPQPNNLDMVYHPLVDFDSAWAFRATDTIFSAIPVSHIEARSFNMDGTHGDVNTFTLDRSGNVYDTWRQVLVYDSGRLSIVYRLRGTDTMYFRRLHYDAMKNVVSDSTLKRQSPGVFFPSHVYHYAYSSTNQNLTRHLEYFSPQGAKTNGHFFTYSYTSTGEVSSVNYQTFRTKSAAYKPVSIDSFGYTPGVPGFTYRKFTPLDTFGNQNGPATEYTCHINSINRRDTITVSQTVSGVTTLYERIILSYNSYGNPTQKLQYQQLYQNWKLRTRENYYYELFNPADVAAACTSSSLKVFPNPTTGVINLQFSRTISGLPITIAISNMVGQLVYSETLVPQGNNAIRFPATAASGLYGIIIYNTKSEVLYKGTFVKQ